MQTLENDTHWENLKSYLLSEEGRDLSSEHSTVKHLKQLFLSKQARLTGKQPLILKQR